MAQAQTTRILVVEDNTGDQVLLSEALEEVGYEEAKVRWATSRAEALRVLKREAFDLVFLDLGLPDSEGVAGLIEIREHADAPVVVLTGRNDALVATEALRVGAADYLIKGRYDLDLLRRVLEGVHQRTQVDPTRLAALTERERELVLLLAKGLSVNECAEEMQISVHTARNHLKRVFRRLELSSQGQLLAWLLGA